MTGEPSLNRRHLPVGQEGHDASSLQVADDCSIAVVTSESPVVDANHVQRFGAWASSSSHHAEHGVVADRQHQALGEVRCWPAAESQSNMMDDAVEPHRPARSHENHALVKALRKNPSPAMRGVAEKPPCHDLKAYAPA